MKPGPKPRRNSCHPRRKHEAKGLCEQCYRAWRRANDPEYAARHRAQSLKGVSKIRAERPADVARQRAEYYERNREYVQARDRARPARAVSPDQRQARRLKTRYGITTVEFAALRAKHKDACAICSRADVKLAIDHDHATGRVRGLLCLGCNTALGNFCDGALFPAAVRYLKASEDSK